MDLEILKGKTILITGGTGSFGKNFTKYILENSEAKKVIVFSRDELKQSVMENDMKDDRLRFFLGDVRDLQRLQRAFAGVDIVVHAAALKQVPALEYNPFEAVKTNILGSQNVIEAAIDQKVERVVLVSTDKAAQPVNLYGSTKLCAEKLFIAGNIYGDGTTRFCVVRYGNVVGSRGSIVETLIMNRNAHTVNITDERMTRFWIDLEKAFAIVLYALTHTEGGEIFIPKAQAMKVSDLFDIIMPKAKRNIIGIRPGEKVHEVLLTREEARHAVELDDYYVVVPEHTELFSREKTQKFFDKGTIPKADFHFSSDNIDHVMSKEELLTITKRMEDLINKKN